MSKIVISGYYGFANAGDEAMLTAIIKALRGREPTAELTVISGAPAVTAARHRVASIHRFDIFRILAAIAGCDLLLSGGGSLLQDVTSKRSLLYYLSVLALGKLLSKKVMLYAQGIGPIRSGVLRRLTKIVVGSADVITVRDRDSLEELQRMGISGAKVRITADAVLALPQEQKERGGELLARLGIDCRQKLIAVSVRQWQQGDAYLKEIAKATDILAYEYGAQVVLLPLQYPADVAACRRLKQLLSVKTKSILLDDTYDTEDFLALMGNFRLLIGMRLHALIFAALMGTPFVAVDYDPKVAGFVKLVGGLSGGRIEELQSETLLTAAELAWQQGQNERGGRLLEQLRQKAMENAELACGLLHQQND